MANRIAEPITFVNSGKTAPNRLLKSAMTERLGTWSDENLDERGIPTPQYVELYRQWGEGQIGTIVLGNIPCDRRYPESKWNVCMDPLNPWDAVAAFKPAIAAAKAHGSLVIGQVTHAGRQTNKQISDPPISSSDVPCPPLGGVIEFGTPRPATIEEIHDIVARFAFAGKTLHAAGADGIQLHAAHGYLLSQFLSPRVNRRTDQYGGSLENRSRILFEIYAAIKEAVNDPSFILSIKINSADFADGGFSDEESRITVQRLEEAGVDLIELSGGTYESRAFFHRSDSTVKREAFFLEFAERITPNLKKSKLAVTGGFRSAEGMNRALEEKSCDIVGLGRPLTAELHLGAELIEGKKTAALENLIPAPLQTPSSYYQIGEAVKPGAVIPSLADPVFAEKLTNKIKETLASSYGFRPILD